MKLSRTRKKWLPLEAERCLILLSNGYEKEEVRDHMNRSVGSINGLLRDMETTQKDLVASLGLSKKEIHQRAILPSYEGPEQLVRSVRRDMPWLKYSAAELLETKTESELRVVTINTDSTHLPLIAGDAK